MAKPQHVRAPLVPSLDEYRRKRDPDRTPEPFGVQPPATGAPRRQRFAIQQHAARRLHYDLRLEMDGVLKSWAVPKGPSFAPEEKHLAVHVEDHPLEYADFEGVIPEGNYGAGSVIVWDRGWYQAAKDAEPLDGLASGRLELEFFGSKMRGLWALVRMKSEKDWLFFRKATREPVVDLTERYPQSVISGLTVHEIRDVPAKVAAIASRVEASGAPVGAPSARDQEPMVASLGDRPFSGPEWLFEIKYDGVRVLAEREGERVALYGRHRQVITSRYPEITAVLTALPIDRFVIDGEIIAPDDEGRPSFQRLQARMGLSAPPDIERMATAVPVAAVSFDCLAILGRDLRRLPLAQRKEILASFVPPLGTVRYGSHVLEDGDGLYEAASTRRLEGIVAKRVTSRYVGGRTSEWIKIKCQRRQEFVIGGYTAPQGTRGYFGALHLGLYEGTRLAYVSKVGTGFNTAGLKWIWEALEPLRRKTSPFDVGTPAGRGHVWVEPRLCCEVRFTEWTADGGIRHPAFLGLRPDKRPEECRRETAETLTALSKAPAPTRKARGRGPGGPPQAEAAAPSGRREVRLTNLDKVYWPEEGYTKGDLVAFYDAVAPVLLPYLADRPLVLTRYPDGVTGKSFFQKDAPDFVPAWVRTERIYSKDAAREINYFIVNDADMLRYVANMGTIPLHIWSAHLPALERPDWLVLDLDPKGAPFAHVVRVARRLHALLEDLRMPNYVKTSGGSGLHVLVPLGARYTHDEARTFARVLAHLALEAEPDIVTLARPLHARGGKVYVDYVQNGHGRTIAAPFSLRPLPGAPASCPLQWDEVSDGLDPKAFTLATLPRHLKKKGDPLAPILHKAADIAAAIAHIEARVEGVVPSGIRSEKARGR